MASTHKTTAKRTQTRRPVGPPGKRSATAKASALAARQRRYAASSNARARAVAHLTPQELAEYRKNNPLPQNFWHRNASNGQR